MKISDARRVLLRGCLFSLAAVTHAASVSVALDPSFIGSGASFTAGSRGYRRFSAYADAEWQARTVDPYGWAQFDTDRSVRQFGFGGGAWKNLRNDVRVKGGLGLTSGNIKDTNSGTSSVTFETGAEKSLRENRYLGAEYRLTAGSIGGTRGVNSNDRRLQERVSSRSAGSSRDPEKYTYNELSGYLSVPLENTRLGLRLSLGLPSYSRSIISETASLKIPITAPLFFTTALTFEQGTASNIYFTVGLYYAFR